MYPYHNRIKQRIRNGELIDYWFTDDYPRIGRALFFVAGQKEAKLEGAEDGSNQ